MSKVNFKQLVELKEKIDKGSPLITKDYNEISNLIDNLAKSSTFAHKAHKEIKAEYNKSLAVSSEKVKQELAKPILDAISWFESLEENWKRYICKDLTSLSYSGYRGKIAGDSLHAYTNTRDGNAYFFYISLKNIQFLYEKFK